MTTYRNLLKMLKTLSDDQLNMPVAVYDPVSSGVKEVTGIEIMSEIPLNHRHKLEELVSLDQLLLITPDHLP